MSSPNRIISAAAGAGKTTRLVRDAIANPDERILITTFTLNNESEIRAKFFDECGHIPPNVTVQTWFTFLLRDLVRPYQTVVYEAKRVRGVAFVDGRSALRIPETNVRRHFFSDGQDIYSDKIAKFGCRCAERSNGAVIRRLERIYDHIYIDEVQDLAAWDLDVLELLFGSEIAVTVVGDYRQSTYQTNNASKYSQYAGVAVIGKLNEWCQQEVCHLEEMNYSLRCNQSICDFADGFFPHATPTESRNLNCTEHDGIFVVRSRDVAEYARTYSPRVLRYDRKNKCQGLPALNFGDSKGLSFDRVLIFPHGPMRDALATGDFNLRAPAKPYIAVTRARYSVAIVHDGEVDVENVVIYATRAAG